MWQHYIRVKHVFYVVVAIGCYQNWVLGFTPINHVDVKLVFKKNLVQRALHTFIWIRATQQKREVFDLFDLTSIFSLKEHVDDLLFADFFSNVNSRE